MFFKNVAFSNGSFGLITALNLEIKKRGEIDRLTSNLKQGTYFSLFFSFSTP